MKPSQIATNAWREILARIFDGFEVQQNLSPVWLVNPETNRPLKLNLAYPEIGVGIRILGLRARQQKRRLSLEEEQQLRQREQARYDLCEAHGYSLANVDLHAETPQQVFVELEMALSKATRRLRQNGDMPPEQRDALLERLSQARSRASTLNRRIKSNQELNPYYELWVDREFQAAAPAASETDAVQLAFEAGMLVEHQQFGLGEVVSVVGQGEDQLVTIAFVEEGQRTFIATLLGDKVVVA